MIKITNSSLHIHDIHNRIPFRYGIAEMVSVPHVFLEIEVWIDTQVQKGYSAESLVPKWFTKNPETTYEDDLSEMYTVIQHACEHAFEAGTQETVFDLWWETYHAQKSWAERLGIPPLLWSFGVSLVERAMIDAFCSANKIPFAQAVHANLFGINLGKIHPQLRDTQPRDFLLDQPLSKIAVRHTIGLGDILTEPNPDTISMDGLPRGLDANIQKYGLRYFKIKINGNYQEDIERIKAISTVLDENCSDGYQFTLDGNEQFSNVKSFKAFWDGLCHEPDLCAFLDHSLFIEQPFHRSVALSDEMHIELNAWLDRPPMIIDESDAEFGSLPRALSCGYSGTSHKNCKGVFKGLSNACLLASLRAQTTGKQFILSGEDLVNIGPIALHQDLAVVAALGISHVERNGHQYFAGLSMFPKPLQEKALAAHGDLYTEHEFRDGQNGTIPIVNIQSGMINLTSVNQAPFGTDFHIDLEFASRLEVDGKAGKLIFQKQSKIDNEV